MKDFVEIGQLLSLYGALLAKSKREILEFRYEQDLGGSEISEILGISRQAVSDALVKGEKELQAIENKLGLFAKINKLEKELLILKKGKN